MIRVMVSGAGGRMGHAVVDAVTAAAGMDVVARVDPALSPGPGVFADVAAAPAANDLAVAVAFAQPASVYDNVSAYLAAGVHGVIGTTGLTDAQLADIRARAAAGPANVVIAPNFCVGAGLMMRFAAEASRHMPRAEII